VNALAALAPEVHAGLHTGEVEATGASVR